MRTAPVDVIATAGTAAQRLGSRRPERTATRSIAQPRPKPRSAAPVVTPSVAPGRTTMVRKTATATPVASEPRTTR